MSSVIKNSLKHTRVVSTIDSTVLCASSTVRAGGGVPGVTVEAVGVPGGDVRPSPVRVEHNGSSLVCAAVSTSASAGLPVKLGVSLGLLLADLLGADGSEDGERGEGESPIHLDC